MPANDSSAALHHDAHERFARLVACIDGVVWEADGPMCGTNSGNPVVRPSLGGTGGEWLRSHSWLDHVHPDDQALLTREWNAAVEGGPRLDVELRVLRGEGDVRHLHVVGEVVRNDAAGAPRMLGIAQDVTESRRAAHDASARETRFRALLDHASDALYVHDERRCVLEANRQACASLGYTLEELVGMSPDQFDADYDLPMLEAFDERMDPDELLCFDTRHRRKDGSTFPVEVRVRRFLDDGRRHAVAIVRDITERKRAEEALAAREAQLRELAEMSPGVMGTYHMRPDGSMCIPYCSPRAWDVYGLRPEELVDDATPLLERAHADDHAGLITSMLESARQRMPWRHEFRFHHPTRGLRWLEGSSMPSPQPDGGVHWYGFVHDITDRKRAEEALAVREAELRDLAEMSPGVVGLFHLRPDGRMCLPFTSPRMWDLFGLHPEDVAEDASPVLERTHPDDRAAYMASIQQSARTLEPWRHEFRVIHPTRGLLWLEGRTMPRPQPDGGITWYGFVHDITDRKRAEESLRFFRQLIDRANDSIEVADPETGQFLDVNERACQVHGYTREEYLKLRVVDIAPTNLPPDSDPDMIELRRTGHVVFESVHRRKDGSTFPVEINSALIQLDRPYIIATVRDITERKRVEEAIRASEERFRILVEHASDAFFLQDAGGRVLDVNQRACESLGYTREELIGMTPLEFDADVDRAMLDDLTRRMFRGEVVTFTSHHRRKDGSTFPVELRIRGFQEAGSGCAVALAHDITERTRLEEELRQAQKMEAVGRLAGGVAHDFNNLLTAIGGFSEMVLDRMAPDDPSRELMSEIRKAGDRAAGLTRQLLAFSRKQVLQPQVVCVNTLLGDLRKLLRPLLGEDIDLVLRLDPDTGLSRVDPGQFEQAVLNLSVNARDAMPRGGRLTIETCNIELGETDVHDRPEMLPGEYVLMSVSDTGAGIDEATRAHMFEPFFTTKGPGKGTGLGLAMVYGFVKQSGGHVEVASEPGRGALIRVYLPRTSEPPTALAAPLASEDSRGTETILLVEDEDSVRSLLRMVLRAKGYDVLEARNGHDAIWVAEQHEGVIHLLVTDLVMPRMGGRALADVLSKARPGLRVLFVSGYVADPADAALEEGVAFLQKPFSATALPGRVREVLDA